MPKRILVVGAGFAGLWSALAAARLLHEQHVPDTEAEVVVVAPRPLLVVRPRLYEEDASQMAVSLRPLFDATGVRFVQGCVDAIHPASNHVSMAHVDGTRSTLAYDSLVLATGSQLFRPAITGLRDHTFSIDQLDDAAELAIHCQGLAARPETMARNTAVVVGGGFTGIEIAAEMPARLRGILGPATDIRVIIVERATDIGPDLGPGPRPVINEALSALGVECRLGVTVTAVDAHGVLTSDNQRIESDTVIWTAGVRASPLTAGLPGEHDALGRIRVDHHLRAPGTTNAFAAGDTACAVTDEAGHHTLMSCQHALVLGRHAGHNAAALVLGLPMLPYSQTRYVTGLDLGPWGAVHTNGWDRQVVLTGSESKARKHFVNSALIYPPPPDREAAFAAANPRPMPPS